jgi:hypothetical protein
MSCELIMQFNPTINRESANPEIELILNQFIIIRIRTPNSITRL